MRTFQHLHAFVLRAPLYALGELPDFTAADSPFRIGLRVASPDFLRTLDAARSPATVPKLARSLLKYQLRASSRCTPFGTFAGLTLVQTTATQKTSIILAPLRSQRFHTRLDARRELELATARHPQNAPDSIYRTNDSLYRTGSQFRYASTEPGAANQHYNLEAIAAEPHLAALLAAAQTGMSRAGLLELIRQHNDVDTNDAESFLAELIEAQVLVAAYLPPLTGQAEPSLPPGPATMTPEQSAAIQTLAEATSASGLSEATFAEVAGALDCLIPDRGEAGPDLQIDTYLTTDKGAFSEKRLDEITAEFEALLPLSFPYSLPLLDQFKKRFAARYESAAVPLLEALDPDLGIGYGNDASAWTGALLESLPIRTEAAVRRAAAQSPDTMPQPIPEPAPKAPDTMPVIVPAVPPDTMPGPLVPHVPDTMPGLKPAQVPDTMPGPGSRFGDFSPALVTADVPDTMPGPLRFADAPDTMPRPVPFHVPDTMPLPAGAVHVPDTMPGPVAAQVPETMPVPEALVHLPRPLTSVAKIIPGSDRPELLVQQKYLQAVQQGQTEIVLTDADLNSLKPHPGARYSKTFSFMGSYQNGADDWRFSINYAGGATALSLLGRFSDGSEPIHALAGALAEREQESEPDCILAEIVHLPSPALGNVSRRPVFRQYEIPYLGVSGAAPEQQLDVRDLMLQLHGTELCLFSRKLGKRVLPRLSTAHNFSAHSLPVYRLLCELQYQGYSQPAVWDWGPYRNEPFLPAVRYRHLILKPRSWAFPSMTLRDITDPGFAQLCTDRGIPRYVRCGQGDQQLQYDLSAPAQAALLLGELRRDPALRIEEAPVEGATPLLRDGNGHAHANELIIPIVNRKYRASEQSTLLSTDHRVRRSFAPTGGNWYYLRLYCGIAAADGILRGGLEALSRNLLERRIISRWFFLRYDEGEPELRVRFCLRDAASKPALEAAVHEWLEPFLEQGSLNRIVLDTYHRELERYGADAIEEIEQLFAADSLCVTSFLSDGASAPDETQRFSFACCAIDALLDDADVLPADRVKVLEPLAAAFFQEHGGGISLQQALNVSYRKHRPVLDGCLGAGSSTYPEEFRKMLAVRSLENRGAFRILQTRTGGDAAILRKLADLMHMQINRTFPAGQRRYEMLIYHCMLRHYRSALAWGQNS